MSANFELCNYVREISEVITMGILRKENWN